MDTIRPPRPRPLATAFTYSIPVLLGYLTIGIAFGLLLSDSGYPWYLALAMSLFIYAGAAQFIAIGLFASGASLWEAVLVIFIVNARHMAYSVSMLSRFDRAGRRKPYLIFALTDETFALLSSLPADGLTETERNRLMFNVSALNQLYWTTGSVAGALAGTLIPFKIEGLSFALTALFVVLTVEQMLRVRRPRPFLIAALVGALATFLLPGRIALLSAMVLSLALVGLFDPPARSPSSPESDPAPGGAAC